MIKDVLTLRELTNAEILDAVRLDASFDYQNRIPEATKAGVARTVNNLLNYRPAWNEFLNAFINRIAATYARNQMWQNPLAIFKKGMLEFGDTVQEYMTDILEAHGYDPDRDYGEKILFGQERPHVEVNFHTINRQDMYKMTINEDMLKRAFLSDDGLQTLLSRLMETPLKSDQYDEFLLMTKLFAQYEANGGFYKLHVPDFSGLGASETDARTALKTVRGFAYRLPIMSRLYNAAHLPMAARPEDLVLIGTPDFLASMDVDGLAPIFHMDKAQIMAERTIGLPEEYFGIDGAQGILTTTDFFMVFDTLIENRIQPNPAGLYDNYFLHHHQIISASRFVPAVLLTSDNGTVTVREDYDVTSLSAPVVSDRSGSAVTTVVRGEIYSLETTGVTDPAGNDVAVDYSITGAESSKTYITRSQVLYVGADETATTLKVNAHTIKIDPTNPRLDPITSTVNLTVSGDVQDGWPVAGGGIVGIKIADIDVPAVSASTTSYAITVPHGTKVTKGSVEVTATTGADVTTTVTTDAALPGYRVKVEVDSGTGAAKVYTVAVTVPSA